GRGRGELEARAGRSSVFSLVLNADARGRRSGERIIRNELDGHFPSPCAFGRTVHDSVFYRPDATAFARAVGPFSARPAPHGISRGYAWRARRAALYTEARFGR